MQKIPQAWRIRREYPFPAVGDPARGFVGAFGVAADLIIKEGQPAPALCTIASFSANPATPGAAHDAQLEVRCFDAVTKAPVDNAFSASWGVPVDPQGVFAAVIVDEPSRTGSYAPRRSHQFTHGLSTLDPITVQRTRKGRYTVTVPAAEYLRNDLGAVRISTLGTRPSRCRVERWDEDAGFDVAIQVSCLGPTNRLADTGFALQFLDAQNMVGTNALLSAYFWSEVPEPAPGNAPDLRYQYNSTNGGSDSPPITRSTDVGSSGPIYRYRLPDLGFSSAGGTFASLSDYGTDSTICNLDQAFIAGPDVLADVFCFDAAGTPAPGRFVLQFHRPMP